MLSNVGDVDKIISDAFGDNLQPLAVPSGRSVWGMTLSIPLLHGIIVGLFYVYINFRFVIPFEWHVINGISFSLLLVFDFLLCTGKLYKYIIVYNIISIVLAKSGYSLNAIFSKYAVIFLAMQSLTAFLCVALSISHSYREFSLPTLCILSICCAYASLGFMRLDLMRYWVPYLSDKSIRGIKNLFNRGFLGGVI